MLLIWIVSRTTACNFPHCQCPAYHFCSYNVEANLFGAAPLNRMNLFAPYADFAAVLYNASRTRVDPTGLSKGGRMMIAWGQVLLTRSCL